MWLNATNLQQLTTEKTVLTDFLRNGSELNCKHLKGKESMISSPASLVIATTAIKAPVAFRKYPEDLITSVEHSKGHLHKKTNNS